MHSLGSRQRPVWAPFFEQWSQSAIYKKTFQPDVKKHELNLHLSLRKITFYLEMTRKTDLQFFSLISLVKKKITNQLFNNAVKEILLRYSIDKLLIYQAHRK